MIQGWLARCWTISVEELSSSVIAMSTHWLQISSIRGNISLLLSQECQSTYRKLLSFERCIAVRFSKRGNLTDWSCTEHKHIVSRSLSTGRSRLSESRRSYIVASPDVSDSGAAVQTTVTTTSNIDTATDTSHLVHDYSDLVDWSPDPLFLLLDWYNSQRM